MLLPKGSEVQHLVHLAHRAHTSLIYYWHGGMFSSSITSSPSCISHTLEWVSLTCSSKILSSSIVSGNPLLTCSLYHRGTCIGQIRLGFFYLHVSSIGKVGLLNLHASSGGRGQAPQPPCLVRRRGSGFSTSMPRAKAGVKLSDPYTLGRSEGQTSQPLHPTEVGVRFPNLYASSIFCLMPLTMVDLF